MKKIIECLKTVKEIILNIKKTVLWIIIGILIAIQVFNFFRPNTPIHIQEVGQNVLPPVVMIGNYETKITNLITKYVTGKKETITNEIISNVPSGYVGMDIDSIIADYNIYRTTNFTFSWESPYLTVRLWQRWDKFKIEAQENYRWAFTGNYMLLGQAVNIGVHYRPIELLPLFVGPEVGYDLQNKDFKAGISAIWLVK